MKKKIVIFMVFTITLVTSLVIGFQYAFKKTYAIGTSLADIVMQSATTSACSVGGTGVCAANSYTSGGNTLYHDYRYRGGEPNNYVRFNGDMYRIIGVFDDYTHGVEGKYLVKLIRSGILVTYSTGFYTTIDDLLNGNTNQKSNDWTGKKTSDSSDDTSPTNVNILLNEYFYNKKELSDIYGECKNWTYCASSENFTQKTNSCSDLVGYGINFEYRDYIEEVTWHLRGYSDTEFSKVDFYLCERGNTSNTSCNSGNSGEYSATSMNKIGLMYASDYLYASSNYDVTDTTTASNYNFGITNWLYKGNEISMSVVSNTNNSNFGTHFNGGIEDGGNQLAKAIRPTFYLKSDVYVTGGTGTFDDPYVVAR